MRCLLLAILFALTLPALAAAQTATSTATWKQAEAPAVASGFQYFLGRSGAALTVKLVQSCVANASNSDCTATIPATFSDGVAVVVPATFTLFVTNAQGNASNASDPLVYGLGATPGKPGGLTIETKVIFKQ